MDKNYESIIEIVSHYTKEGKFAICRFLSFCSSYRFGMYKDLNTSQNSLMPWEVETIITIILLRINSFSEPKYSFPSSKFDNDISEILKILSKNEVPPVSDKLNEMIGPYSILSPLFVKQITYQRYIYTRIYRFNYIFTYDDTLKNFFKKKTNTDNYFIYGFLSDMHLALLEQFNNKTDILDFVKYQLYYDFILESYANILNPLICDINLLMEKNINNLTDLIFAYKTISNRPIIIKDYVPFVIAPVCMEYACTEGLFLNITSSENEILTHIGSVFEDYLYHLLDETKSYVLPDKIKRRKHYNFHGDKLPADAILKNDDTVVIFETKERVYRRLFYSNDFDAIAKEYEYAIDAIKQLLDYLIALNAGAYNPFNDESDKNKEKYLVLTKLFYLPFNRDKLIDEVTKNRKYCNYKDYLEKHLLITDIDTLELFFLHNKDFIGCLKKASLDKKMDSFAAYRPKCESFERTPSFKKFMDKMSDFSNKQIQMAANRLKRNNKLSIK